jgi:hypothetical protein
MWRGDERRTGARAPISAFDGRFPNELGNTCRALRQASAGQLMYNRFFLARGLLRSRRDNADPVETNDVAHHILPPMVYMPPPRPKKTERRKNRIQPRSSGEVEDAVDDAEATSGLGAPGPVVNRLPLPTQIPIEGSERKPASTPRFLSATTLTALLAAQEIAE